VDVGACEHCGSIEELDSAHVSGRSRLEIIDIILGSAAHNNRVIKWDLDRFEQKFRSEHMPLEKAVLILCRKCHRKYDTSAMSLPPQSDSACPTVGRSSILPITFDPQGVTAFKRAFLVSKAATISIVYADGRTEKRHWNASKISWSSNILRNLRSRPYLRQGEWQSNGIVTVHVNVKTNKQTKVPRDTTPPFHES
jgi:hypothetical protein